MNDCSITNNLQYQGIVDLYTLVDNKFLHMKRFNSGLPNISKLFSYICLDYSAASSFLPKYVDLRDENGRSVLSEKIAYKAKWLNTYKISGVDWYCPVYDVLIMSDDLLSSDGKKLVLLSEDESELAEVDISTASYSISNNILIKWLLRITNATVNGEING